MPRLENWSVIFDESDNEFMAPECKKKRLQGYVYDRGGFDDGRLVRTSSIQSLDLKNNVAVTRNTKYQLGEVDKDYLKWLENCGLSLEKLLEKSK